MHYKRRSRRKDRTAYAACGCCKTIEKTKPVESEVCNGKSRSKRVRSKKERCPVNGTHEWYKEWVEETDWYVPFESCDKCGAWYCAIHGERTYYKRRSYDATCIHCWKTKVLKTESDRDRWLRKPGHSRYGFGKLYLPKRSVKF